MKIDIAVLMAVGPSELQCNFSSALDSVLGQSYSLGDIHVVVVNDGNTDQSVLNYLKKIETLERIYILNNESNVGLAASLNKAIEFAAKEINPGYFIRMDADDISLPLRFQKQVDFMEIHPHVSVSGSDLIEFHEVSGMEFIKKLPSNPVKIKNKIFWRCPLNHPTVIIRRHIFLEGYRYNENLRVSQDYDLWIRLVLDGKIITNIPEVLLRFRVQKNFLDKRNSKKAVLEFKYKMQYIKDRRIYRASPYIHALIRLAIGVLPARLRSIAYSVSRKKIS